MKHTRTLVLTLVASFATGLALLPADAAAQRPWRWDNRRPVGRPDWTVRPLVDRSERESNAFRAWFERNYDHRGLGRYHDNRWLKHEIQKMDEAMERLRGKADDHRPGVGRDQLQSALEHARLVDREIYRDGDARFTIREWSDLRGTLNDLADLYGVRGV